MRRRLIHVVVVLVVLFAAAQLVRPSRANVPTDPSRTIQAHAGTTGSGLVVVLDRACGDCHSNSAVWPWPTRIAPVSWLMAYEITQGRKAVNFSEWAGYQPALRQKLLVESCRDATTGKMPGPYALLRPITRLSAADIETICAAARKTETVAITAR